jgi:hypothetical protein
MNKALAAAVLESEFFRSLLSRAVHFALLGLAFRVSLGLRPAHRHEDWGFSSRGISFSDRR